MTTKGAMAQRAGCMIVGTALSIVGLIFTALGVTLFPVIGILIGLPIMGLAFNYFRPAPWAFAAESHTEPVMGQESWDEEFMAA